MNEKQNIEVMLKHLKMSMLKARMFSELKDLTYDPDQEVVKAEFYYDEVTHTKTYDEVTHTKTYVKEINVACDSNGAMIYDVVRVLYDFCR